MSAFVLKPKPWMLYLVTRPYQWITLGHTIYHPRDTNPLDWPAIVEHEKVHVAQQERDGLFIFLWRYTFSRRARLEYEAQAIAVELHYTEISGISAKMAWYSNALASSIYLWAATSPEAALKAISEAFEKGISMREYGRGNLVFLVGTDWSRVLAVKNPDLTPVDLTGFHARFQVRAAVDAPTAILSLGDESPATGITMGGALGTITLTVPNAALTEGPGGLELSSITAAPAWLNEDLDDGTRLRGFGPTAVFALELISPGGAVDRIFWGSCVFDREACRA